MSKLLHRIGARTEEDPTRLGMRYALRPTRCLGLQAKRSAKFSKKLRRLQNWAKVKQTGKRPRLMLRALAAG